MTALALAACSNGTEPSTDVPSQFIAVRRAWLPGERAATIASIMQSGGLGIASPFAAEIYADPDSVTVIAANPDFSVNAASPSGLFLAPRFQATWNIGGMDLLEVNVNPVPPDTIHWVGVMWSNPAEPRWQGFVFAAATAATVPRIDINTIAFDASGGKTGAGGGESRQSTGTLWQGNGPIAGAINDMQVTASAFGAASTVTTGPFLGGTKAAGTMFGRLQKISMTRIQGADAPNPMTVDFDFRAVSIGAVKIICVFNSPCTTNFPAGAASLLAHR